MALPSLAFHVLVAACAGKVVEHPFDTVKVRLQAQQHGPGKVTTIMFKNPLFPYLLT